MKTIRLKDAIGSGWENDCWTREAPAGETPSVIKFMNSIGRLWSSSNTRTFIEICERTAQKAGLATLQTTIHEKVTLVFPDETSQEVPLAIETDFIPDIGEQHVEFENLIGQRAPIIIDHLIDLIQNAHVIRKEDNLGIDIYGGGLIKDSIQAIPERVLLALSESLPESLAQQVRQNIKGVRGIIENLIHHDPDNPYTLNPTAFVLTDLGMHDLSPTNPVLPIVQLGHYMTYASLPVVLEHCINRIPDLHPTAKKMILGKLASARSGYDGPESIRIFAEFAAREVLIPMMEHYQTRKEAAERGPDPLVSNPI